MSEDAAGDGPHVPEQSTQDVEEPASSAEAAVHHGEALVAALLNTQKVVAEPIPSEQLPPESAQAPPLTASTVMAHTDQTAIAAERVPVSAAVGALAVDGAVNVAAEPSDQVPITPSDDGDGLDGEGNGEAGDDGDDVHDDEETSFARNVLEWIVVLGAAVLVAVILRTFVFQAFFIPSESMEATLFEDDRILVNKVSYRLHDVNRGDVVVFRRPDDQPGEIRDLIKRVIGLPGDTVEGRNSQVFINGQQLVEPYLDGNQFSDFGPITVPEDELFMMGDNRDQSLDSRRFGTINEDRIVGRAFFLFYPFDRIGTL